MSLQPEIVALVLLAAVVHATWNALAKGSGDKLITVAVIQGSQTVFALFALPFVPVPSLEAFPYLIASVVIHTGYFYFLMKAYEDGDLSHVYPLARGSAPLLVAILTSVLAIETPSMGGIAGILLVSAGIISLGFVGNGHYPSGARPVRLALTTGLFISAYTLSDGLGTRAGDQPFSYIVWLFLWSGIPFCMATAYVRRKTLFGDVAKRWKAGAAAGFMSALAYALVLYAMSLNAMAYVSALRETSVLFAALIGIIAMKEPLGLRRILAAGAITVGIIVMQVAG
ncbi:MAG: EamA family transporter [Rhodospirillales bacterium]|jgi:drug/metabolite transporter (DMT)-like permease|nr:EamA family transporter [Rhodospirillales bacterium]